MWTKNWRANWFETRNKLRGSSQTYKLSLIGVEDFSWDNLEQLLNNLHKLQPINEAIEPSALIGLVGQFPSCRPEHERLVSFKSLVDSSENKDKTLLFHKLNEFNPLLPSAHKSAEIAKISILKLKGTIKKFLWASRLWVGRWKEPILGYDSKNYEKKNSGSKGLKNFSEPGKVIFRQWNELLNNLSVFKPLRV